MNTKWVLSPTEGEGPWVNQCCLTCVQLWILSWFSPTSQTPLPTPHRRPALSSLRVCPDQTPTLLSTQLTLPLQLFSDPSSHSGSSSRSSDREQTSLPSAPLSLSSSTPTRCPAVLALWGPFSPRLSVHTGPSVPEPGAVRRIRKKGGLPFPPAPPGGAHALRGRT